MLALGCQTELCMSMKMYTQKFMPYLIRILTICKVCPKNQLTGHTENTFCFIYVTASNSIAINKY